MNVLRRAKDNLSIVIILVAYATLFILRPEIGITSFKNSVYYIKEMIVIMPVVFVLTALLGTWVPKEKIIKYLGQDAKTRGVILSLLLGSISAGPIYAAFPLCVMLHKKGASVRNLVVILSSWAVIKVPMLLNELKFLGFQFMAVRWLLTVISIVVFSWMTAIIVKDKDLPEKTLEHQKNNQPVSINRSACIGCSICTKKYPELFEMKNKKVSIKIIEGPINQEKLMLAISSCPVKIINFISKR